MENINLFFGLDDFDSMLPSDNIFNIPSLRMDRQPLCCTRPFFRFGEMRRTPENAGKGTLCFYEADTKFKNITLEKILKQHPQFVVETNESIFDETDITEALSIIKRKRYMSRILQNYGIGIFVDMHVSIRYSKMNLIGVPKGYKAYCTKGTSNIELLEYEYDLARNHAEGDDLIFVVYGGSKKCLDFCKDHAAIYVFPGLKLIGKANKLKIQDGALPIFDPFQVEEEIKKLWDNQITNFKSDFNG